MTDTAPVAPPPLPRTFREYVSSFGPGIIVVLTWLAARDVVGMGVVGAEEMPAQRFRRRVSVEIDATDLRIDGARVERRPAEA